MALQPMQEAFAVAVVKNGGDKVSAYKEAGYSTNLNPNAMGAQADKFFNHPKISIRIAELKAEADKVAKEAFNISIEWRLRRLKEISDAGVSKYEDGNGVSRYENLAASNAAVKTMNEMLGVNNGTDESKALPIQVTIGVKDCSVK